MPETLLHIKARAKQLGYPLSQIVKGKNGYYLAPLGVESQKAKNFYAECRSRGDSKEKCARLAHYIDKQ